MLAEGKSEAEILKFYETQYGERILARPKAGGFNLLVWILPIVVLLTGAGVVWKFLRARQPASASATANTPPASIPADEKYRVEIEKELYGTSRDRV